MAERERNRVTRAACQRLLAVFLADKAERTARTYAADLEAFAAWMAEAGVADAKSPVDALVELLGGGRGHANAVVSLYRGAMRRRLAASTTNRRLATLRSVAAKAGELEMTPWTLTVRNLKARPMRDTAGPGRQNVRAMLAHAEAMGGEIGLRDAAMVMLLYGLALRREEVVSLDFEHVDLSRPAVAVLGKGRTDREWIVCPLEVQEALAAWMVARGGEPGPLFCSLSRAHGRGRLTGNGLLTVVRRLGEAVGCRATPHGLRHTAITDAIQSQRYSLTDVQTFSRHADLRTLQVYFDAALGVARDIAGDIVAGLKAT